MSDPLPPPPPRLPNHRISGERCAAPPHRQPSERGTEPGPGEGRGEERRLPLRRGVPGGAQGLAAAPGPGSCLKAARCAPRRCFPVSRISRDRGVGERSGFSQGRGAPGEFSGRETVRGVPPFFLSLLKSSPVRCGGASLALCPAPRGGGKVPCRAEACRAGGARPRGTV